MHGPAAATIIEINPTDDDFSSQAHHKMAPHVVTKVSDEMKVMQDEIFGPILPIKTYDEISEAVDYINLHAKPLGLYYFGTNTTERDYVLGNTTSGGVTVNDVIFHVAQEELPFGGIGPSGMGAYHGKAGFLEFSHRRAVYTQPSADILAILRPPYGDTFRKILKSRIRR